MRRRRLRPDEAELWEKVIAAASPLRPKAAAHLETPLPEPRTAPAPRTESVTLPPLIRRSEFAPTVTLDLRPDLSAAQRIDMDRKKFGRMKRGKLAPEGRIDLHGMTQAQAHSALTGFVLMSHQMGRRLVLVITGKGQGPAAGVLRQQVPHWLSLPPLRGVLLHMAEAHQSHGGGGALYVYLRRKRDS